MPEATVTLITHEPDAYGYCAHCGKTDLAVSYQNGHLDIEGLTGRTYDSWPQMLTGIALVPGAGQTAVTLTMPDYRYQNNIGKWMMYACGTPKNEEADFEVRYANNTAAYPYREGEAGFDADKAPKVTITGRGKYTGEFTVYFTIGKGTMRPQVNNLEVCGSSACYYDGRTEKAWNNSLIEFYGDAFDAKQWSQCSMVQQGEWYISQITTPEVMNTYAEGSVDICPTTVEYRKSENENWIMERLEGASAEDMYMITDAGEYPFWVRMTNANCENEYITEKLVARILPKTLTEGMVAPVADAFAYYTGSGVECTAYDTGAISDSGITVDGSPYALKKDKDYTVAYENNMDVTNGGNKAKLIITGIGNYGGEAEPIELEFAIRYAFTPAQTAASKTGWYNGDVTALFGTSDSGADAGQVLYASTLDEKLSDGLGSDIRAYATLDDAADGTGAEYVFAEEGEVTKTLYVRDVEKGYVGSPVEVTLHIDKTAPTWEATAGNSGDFGISIKENWWKTLLNTVSFGRFYNDASIDLVLRANDAKDGVNETSGVAEYFYYIDTVDASALPAAKTKAELDALMTGGKFTEVPAADGGRVTISGVLSAEKHYIVYACAKDAAGNLSDYICTEGVVVDRTAPEITSATAPTEEEGTLADHEATVTFDVDEAGTVVYFYIGGYEDDAQFESDKTTLQTMLAQDMVAVKLEDGRWRPAVENGQTMPMHGISPDPVIYSRSMQEGENAITLSGLKANKGYRLYLMVIDKTGNLQTAYKTVDFTTRKLIPIVSANPALNGVYGMQAKDFTVGAGTVVDADAPDTVLAGAWTFTDTAAAGEEYPVPGTTEEYELTFTPDNDAYESVSVEIVPTVEKKELTVYVAGNLEKTYGEENPGIAYVDAADEPDSWKELLSWDRQDEVKADLALTTTATKTSGAGSYDFTVTSANAKYDVKVKYRVSDAESVSYPDHGTLTVKKADAVLTAGTDSYAKTFGDDAFTLDVTASHTETAIVYEVTDGSGVVSVAADGTVTILKAGTAKIKISLPGNANYNAAADREITVTVAKKNAPTVADVNRNYYYDRDNQDSIDIGKLLPVDCGKITGNAVSGHAFIVNCGFNEETGILSYTIQKNKVETRDITVTVETENYNAITVVIHTNWVDKREVFAKAGTEVALKNSTLTYGDRLSALAFADAEFVDGDGNPVAGTLAWEDESLIPAAGTASANWKFTPDDEAYIARTDSVSITVDRATPKADSLPAAAEKEIVYDPLQTLAGLELSGGNVVWTVGGAGVTVVGTWSWSNAATVPTVDVKSYEVTFTPLDTANYKTFKANITVTVTKAKPYIETVPAAAQITYGDSLGASALSGGKVLYGDGRGNAATVSGGDAEVAGTFTWKNPDTKPTVADSDSTEYEIVFEPMDSTNYETVTTKGKLAVKKAEKAPDMPDDVMKVAFDCGKVADVALGRNNWAWKDSDLETALTVGAEVTATAVYTGADKGNYEIETVVVRITRSQRTETVVKPEDSKRPFIKGENGKEGWDVIRENAKSVTGGGSVTVDMNGTTVVPSDLFELIRGRNVTLTFDMVGGILWRVNGRDVAENRAGDIDFGVKTGANANNVIPVEVINNITGEKAHMNLSLAYDGEFGFRAVLSLNVDAKNAGMYANLYYYNERTGALEFMSAGRIAADGTAELVFTHASEYTIVIDKEVAVRSPKTGEPYTPAAGILLLLLGTLLLSQGCVLCHGKYKRKVQSRR